MLTVFFLLVNTITLTLVVKRTYEFITGMTNLYSTYWTNAQIDVAFLEYHATFKVISLTWYLTMDKSIRKLSPHT